MNKGDWSWEGKSKSLEDQTYKSRSRPVKEWKRQHEDQQCYAHERKTVHNSIQVEDEPETEKTLCGREEKERHGLEAEPVELALRRRGYDGPGYLVESSGLSRGA